jgi:putative membrane protein
MAPEAPHPDSRMLQANERTLLAWLRTGISLITFGFVIARLGMAANLPGGGPVQLRVAILVGGAFVILGAAADALGIARYVRLHRSLLQNAAPRTGAGAVVVLALAVAVLGSLLSVFVLLDLRG